MTPLTKNSSFLGEGSEESVNYSWLFLIQVEKRIKTIWDQKLQVAESTHGEAGLPRLVRLCRKLKLTEKETLIMTYVLCCQVGESRSIGSRMMRLVEA